MKQDLHERLAFLARVVEKEAHHLSLTDGRIFAEPFDVETVKALDTDTDLAEQVDAFVARFGRLQDTIGDKLLPALLTAMGERIGPAIDNLDKAERFGWVSSADNWLATRHLRNKMIHEYIEDPAILANALNAGHQFVPQLQEAANRMIEEVRNHNL